VQDAITMGDFLFNFGFRLERYNSVTTRWAWRLWCPRTAKGTAGHPV